MKDLFHFAYFPSFEDSIKYLAGLCAPEEWDFTSSTIKRFEVLKNYLNHTFKKVYSEDKVKFSKNNEFCSFNTGLYTPNFEDIFAFFEKNRRAADQAYVFKAFLKNSDSTLNKTIPHPLPDTADYFSAPDLLIYNSKLDLIVDLDHIIEDNIERFPQNFKNLSSDEILRRLRGAVELVKKMVRSNYKIAVPQFFNGRIQLLLPLHLTDINANPDLVLAVSRENSVYIAKTCLSLRMAYQNARLIVKPQSSWLDLSKIY